MYLEKATHKIYYKDSGDKDMPAIIFIHGFPLDHSMWNHSIKFFRGKYRTVACDIRGLGKSTLPDIPYTFEFYVDDLLDLMNHLGIEKAVIAGLSMGGYIALRAFERIKRKTTFKTNPENSSKPGDHVTGKNGKFSGLILCDTQARGDHNQALLGRFQNIKILTEQGIDVFTERFLNNLLSRHTIENRPEAAGMFRSIVKNQSMKGIAATLVALATRTTTEDFLNQIDIPTLLVAGENDALTPPAMMSEMADMIKGATLKIIPGAGHMSPMENPEKFNQIMAEFLKEHSL